MIEDSLFLDKLSITAAILRKESELVGEMSSLIADIEGGILKQEKLTDDIKYSSCLRIIHELYSFFKFNKLEENKIDTKKKDKLDSLMEKYLSLKNKIQFEELYEMYLILLELISKCGYHVDKVRTEEESLDDY